MGLKLNYINGQTPIDDDEKDGLRIPTISTQGELNEYEQKNIEEAILWTLNKPFDADAVLNQTFICKLLLDLNIGSWVFTAFQTEMVGIAD